MTDEERRKATEWFGNRAKNCPMPATRRMYEIATEALEEQRTGHWIMHDKHRECSECKVWLPKDMPRNSYCPNCGCKMEE